MSSHEISLNQAINSLMDLSAGPDSSPSEFYYLGPSSDLTRSEVSGLIFRIERLFWESSSAALEFWLGISFRNYTLWFLRAEDRAPMIHRAAEHLERAYALVAASSQSGIERSAIALELGTLLLEEARVQDPERGTLLLKEAFLSTEGFDPRLCLYAESLLASGDCLGAAEAAAQLMRRAERSTRWREHMPQRLLDIASRAFRAWAGECESSGDIGQALLFLRKIIAIGQILEGGSDPDEEIASRA